MTYVRFANKPYITCIKDFIIGEDAHDKMKSKFHMPRLKSFELVSSISTKFDDYVQRMKFHKDFDIDQANTTSKNDKKIYPEEDEKNHEFNMEVEDQSHIGLISHTRFSEISNSSRSVENNTNFGYPLKSNPSSPPQQMKLSMLKEGLRNNEEFNFNDKCKKQELNAIGTYKSRGVKGVKEDCERFRLQMKILKKKANDSRIREVMVEGLVENLHKNLNEENIEVITIEDTNDIIENDQVRPKIKSISKNPISSIHDLNIEGKITKNGSEIEINKKNEKKLFASSTAKERSNSPSSYTSKFDGKNSRQTNAHEDFKARKRIKTYNNVPSHSNTSNSSTSSSASSLSSLPLSHYIQKLKCLAPISSCPSNSFININKNVAKNEQVASLNTKSFVGTGLNDCQKKLQDSQNSNSTLVTNYEKTTNFNENKCNMQVDRNIKNHLYSKYLDFNVNTLIPTPTSHFESNTHLEIHACQRAKKSIVDSIKNNSRNTSGDKINKKIGNIMITNYVSPEEIQPSNKNKLEPFSSTDGIVFHQSKYHNNEVC